MIDKHKRFLVIDGDDAEEEFGKDHNSLFSVFGAYKILSYAFPHLSLLIAL